MTNSQSKAEMKTVPQTQDATLGQPKFGFGQSIKRVEDGRLVTGQGSYTDDTAQADDLVAYVFRSTYAVGRIGSLDVSEAREAPGVRMVMTAAELDDDINSMSTHVLTQSDGSKMPTTKYPLLATDRVRFVGQPVAFIVADSLAEAKDAAELIEFDVEEDQEAAADYRSALQPGQPLVHSELPSNKAFDWARGDEAKTEAGLAAAEKTIEFTIDNNRVISSPMELRAARAVWDQAAEKLTLTSNTQGGWGMKKSLANNYLKIDPEQVRVVTPDVGGGFGTRAFTYPEHPLVALAAHRLQAAVRWAADRSENMLTDLGGRANLTTATIGLDADNRITTLKIHLIADMGAYLSGYAAGVPTECMIKVATGVYHIPNFYCLVNGVYTHTAPVDAYRGAGRPEAIYLVERLMDHAAAELGIDRLEFRRINFVTPDMMPYTAAHDEVTYDTGNFDYVMNATLEKADWHGFEARRQEAAKQGKRRGIGLCYYIESTLGNPEESTAVSFDDGVLSFTVGTQSNGQGHETAFAQAMAGRLGVPMAHIKMIQGDTDAIPTGGGTGGSRSMVAQVTAINAVSDKIIETAKRLAAADWEVPTEDMRFDDGILSAEGTNRTTTILQIASDHPGQLDDQATTKLRDNSYPNGCHIAEVEVDPDTGETQIIKYTILDDFGRLLNPLIVEGQVHGGVVQGLGQALTEHVVFDETGQLMTGSYMDYAMPRADNMPHMDFHYTEDVPAIGIDFGAKGCGEAGSIASPAAVINAIIDALKVDGVDFIDMPATPQRVWRAIQEAQVAKAA